MTAAKVIIKTFPADGKLWRVQWFGQLSLNPHIFDEPLIEVILTPFTLLHDGYPRFDTANSKTVCIGVGQLPLVHIGSVWQNGELQPIHRFKVEQKTYKSLKIFPSTMRTIKTIEKVEGEYLLPYKHHYYGGKESLLTRCLCIERNGDPYHLIIPAIEIARFYYVQTSKLARIIFNGQFWHSQDVLYNTDYSKTFKHEGLATVQLRTKFDNPDAWIAARLAFSEVALNKALAIYDSILKNYRSREGKAIPEAYPPFEGQTDLKVYGKTIKSQSKSRFLVFWIGVCSAPFPFDDVVPVRDNSGDAPLDPTDDREECWSNKQVGNVQNQSGSLEVQNEEEPYSQIEETVCSLTQNRFSYLDGKKLLKAEKVSSKYKAGDKGPCIVHRVNKLSTGGGVNTPSNSAQINIQISPTDKDNPSSKKEPPLPATFPNFIEALDALTFRGNIEYKIVPASKKTIDEGGRPMSLFPERVNGQRIPFSYIKSKPAKERRKVMVAEVCFTGRTFYFMEIQQRSTKKLPILFAHKQDFQPLGQVLLETILEKCAENKGNWIDDNEVVGVNRTKIKHLWSSAEIFAKKMLTCMNEASSNR